jgi:multicomponent Na+:H+ antiporter subunit E
VTPSPRAAEAGQTPSPSPSPPPSPSPVVTALVRGVLFLLIWIVLMPSANLADLTVGVFASLVACWTSMHLLPRAAGHVRLLALLRFMPHFMWQSVLAGIDVARRALDPAMPLRPGFVVCPVGFPPGLARNEFASITSLMPGSVPVGESAGAIIFHCLDITQPVALQMAEEERRVAGVLAVGDSHD